MYAEWEFERDLYSRFKMAVISFYKQFKLFPDGFYIRHVKTAFNYVYKLKQTVNVKLVFEMDQSNRFKMFWNFELFQIKADFWILYAWDFYWSKLIIIGIYVTVSNMKDTFVF